MIWTKQPIKNEITALAAQSETHSNAITSLNSKVVSPTVTTIGSYSDLKTVISTVAANMPANSFENMSISLSAAFTEFPNGGNYGIRIHKEQDNNHISALIQGYNNEVKFLRYKNGTWSIDDFALKSSVDSLDSNITALARHTRKTSFSLTDLQAAVAEQNLAKYGLKPGDETTINGHTYVIAGLNVMKGTHSHTCTSNHVGLIVIPHTIHAWNASGHADEGADGRGAGYFNCDLQYYLENDVMTMCNTDLGSGHLYTHRKLMGNAINTTGYNRFGTNSGCTSGWAWKENCYISALTEAQVFGGDHWSSSGYDTGEANTLLPVFAEYKHTEIFKNEYPWLRNVSSASQACNANGNGLADGAHSVSGAYPVAGLILYH